MKRLIIALLVACTIIGFLLRLGSGGQVLRLSARELQQSGYGRKLRQFRKHPERA